MSLKPANLSFEEAAAVPMAAVTAAEAAHAQGSFWEMHDLMFAHQDALDPRRPVPLRRRAGAGRRALLGGAMRTRKHAPRIARDVDSADQSGVVGTPTFFINGRRHYGPYDLDTLAGRVEREARETIARGRPA